MQESSPKQALAELLFGVGCRTPHLHEKQVLLQFAMLSNDFLAKLRRRTFDFRNRCRHQWGCRTIGWKQTCRGTRYADSLGNGRREEETTH